ncbi:AMP-binding protein [Sinorhizobium meliloti]|uniref:AMP-binding protein n=1 Tax=Rhizobium meliloti TaxID=382 RepID=UPI003D658B31
MYNFFFDRILQSIDVVDAPFAFLDGGAKANYSDLINWSARYANSLAELGLQPGDFVVCPLRRDIHQIFLYIATLRAGGIFVPLNEPEKLEQLERLAAVRHKRIFVCADTRQFHGSDRRRESASPNNGGATRYSAGHPFLFELASRAQSQFQDAIRVPNDPAVLFLDREPSTFTHRRLANEAARVVTLLRLTSSARLIQAVPVSDPNGFLLAANVVMLSNGSMYFYEKFAGQSGEEALRAATYVAGVRGYYDELVSSHSLNSARRRDIQVLLTDQVAFSLVTEQKFPAITGHSIVSNFGL